TDTREKLQAYRAIESLRYYLVIDSERVALTYYSRSSGGEWLTTALEGAERISVQCGSVQASLGLAEIYEDTGLKSA
ncbi:MAG: hypothetical protein ACKVQA_02120, partial [Burkholderiales bacterium]